MTRLVAVRPSFRADFSHDPEDAGRLLARVATDADVAIGSRYVAGGAVDETWGFRRRQLSPWGNRMARWIAGLKGVRDCTAGFKAIRTSALRDARVAEISVLGYAFQVALLHRLLHSGARVVEEPISTSATASAASPSSASAACWSSCTTSGGCASPATAPSSSYGTFLVLSLVLPRVAPVWLQGLAIVPAVLVNYFLNSYWTFRDAERD